MLGFPIQLISILCCPSDGTALELGQNSRLSDNGGFIRYGTLRCNSCNATFAIDDGILNMLNDIAMARDDESKHEQQLRNEAAIRSMKATGPAWFEDESNSMERIPTMEALSVSSDQTILELGCGDGRYTVLLNGQCKSVLAVDFSIESLRLLKQRLRETRSVGLVLGDITILKVRAAAFDRVLSTLVSNLPTREHRNAMYHLAAQALAPYGRFVFSTHNHGIKQILSGVPKAARYDVGGIYRYNFTVSECKAEVRSYFRAFKAWPIQIHFPFARTLRLPLPLVATSRFLERVPLINGLGELILCTAEQPVQADSSMEFA